MDSKIQFVYKGYTGVARYDEQSGWFHGDIQGMKDVVTFRARHVDALEQAFKDSLEDYLEFCVFENEKKSGS